MLSIEGNFNWKPFLENDATLIREITQHVLRGAGLMDSDQVLHLVHNASFIALTALILA